MKDLAPITFRETFLTDDHSIWNGTKIENKTGLFQQAFIDRSGQIRAGLYIDEVRVKVLGYNRFC